MAKGILPIATVTLVSLLSGVAITLVFTGEVLENAIPSEQQDDLVEVQMELRKTQALLGRMEKNLARDLSATRSDMHEVFAARPRVVRASASMSMEGMTEGDPALATHVSRDKGEPMPPKNAEALGGLANWKADSEARSQWLFTSERAALDAFGTPDEVSARGTSEWWTYWNVQGDKIVSEYRLQFNSGRLVEASMLTWEKARRLPTAQR